MKNIFVVLAILFSNFLLAQSEEKPRLLNQNNFVFSLALTSNPSHVSGNLPNTNGLNNTGIQLNIAYLMRIDEHFSGEIGLGIGSLQNGYGFSLPQSDYPFLKYNSQNYEHTNSESYLFVPTRVIYNKPINERNEVYGFFGATLHNYGQTASIGSTFSGTTIDDKSINLARTVFSRTKIKGEIYPSVGFGYQRNTRRFNSIRLGVEYQFPRSRFGEDFSLLQPDKTYATSRYYARGDMFKASLSFVISNKKEIRVKPKRDFNTAKKDILLSFEYENSGSFLKVNDPKNYVSSPFSFEQAGFRLGLEYLFNPKWSLELAARYATSFECFEVINTGSRGCGGTDAPLSFSLNTHYYYPISKRIFLNSGAGFSVFKEDRGYSGGGSMGIYSSPNYFEHSRINQGIFATLDLSESIEFSIFRAMRLYLKGQYAQGFTKAYTYDFTNKVNGESNSFTGFSRGSYVALRAGVKFNFGYLRS